MYLADERIELSERDAPRGRKLRFAIVVFKGVVAMDIREFFFKDDDWQFSTEGVRLNLGDVEAMENLIVEYHKALKTLGIARVGLKANGTSPRQLGKAPRQRVKAREEAIERAERALALKEAAIAGLEAVRAKDDNVIDVRGRIEAKNAPQKGEEAA